MLFKNRVIFYCFVVLILLTDITVGQDRRISDSLICILNNNNNLTSEQKLEIYKQIGYHHTFPDSAIFFSNQLIDLANKSNDTKYLFNGYKNKAYAYVFKGELDTAITLFFKCASIASRDLKEKYWLATSYIGLGDSYSRLKNYKNSTYYFNKAIEILKNENDTFLLANAFFNSASNYLYSENMDTALQFFEEAGRLFRMINYELGMAYTLGNIGQVYVSQGKLEKAEKNLTEAIKILTDFNDPLSVSYYYLSLGSMYRKQKKYQTAISCAAKAYEISLHTGMKPYIKDACRYMADFYSQVGDYKSAYKYQTLSYSYSDSLADAENRNRIADLRTEFEVAIKQREVDYLVRKRKSQNIIQYTLIVSVLLSSTLMIFLYRNYRKKKALNRILQEQKEELLAQQEQLEELNNTKDRFFSILSHDLRGPIASIGTFPEILVQYINEEEKENMSDLLVMVQESVKKVSSLLDNLLEWALTQQGSFPNSPEKINLKLLVKEIKTVFITMAGLKEIKLTNRIAEDIFVIADKNSLMTILRNLISNAIKFTKKGGKIVISACADAHFAVISVKDNGIGMPKEKIESIFSFSEKKSTWGTNREKGFGIGLTLVHEFVKMNNGRIEVESEPGEGTTFKVYIPLVNELMTN